ncbi:thymidylate synthase [Agrobacterium phage OLIVR5]|uniref:Thymidylate synthase n=1 Tax=Agrobacterium phage OLIVR5 TaxID=2723773 RepID=A0A858MSA8_9CAUD|nr:thymidylate synthase [Agrobacterium phage OLIVR5]QIW87667.1 thymidylate synthase [Agrobacterium phage OLIVR5]QIW87926.1 thymidylate synthase [Agrobacterium phage OLIVR6]
MRVTFISIFHRCFARDQLAVLNETVEVAVFLAVLPRLSIVQELDRIIRVRSSLMLDRRRVDREGLYETLIETEFRIVARARTISELVGNSSTPFSRNHFLFCEREMLFIWSDIRQMPFAELKKTRFVRLKLFIDGFSQDVNMRFSVRMTTKSIEVQPCRRRDHRAHMNEWEQKTVNDLLVIFRSGKGFSVLHSVVSCFEPCFFPVQLTTIDNNRNILFFESLHAFLVLTPMDRHVRTVHDFLDESLRRNGTETCCIPREDLVCQDLRPNDSRKDHFESG